MVNRLKVFWNREELIAAFHSDIDNARERLEVEGRPPRMLKVGDVQTYYSVIKTVNDAHKWGGVFFQMIEFSPNIPTFVREYLRARIREVA